MRYLAISDIHGCLKELNLLLEKLEYDPKVDQLILLGDYVDRGMNSKGVLERVMELVQDGAIALRGNHDHMMLLSFAYPNEEEYHEHWLGNGAVSTITSYFGTEIFQEGFDWEEYQEAYDFIQKHYAYHIEFLKTLPFYHETSSHLYVHAGIDPFYEDFKKQPAKDFLWIRDIFFRNQLGIDKVVVFGHTPTRYLFKNDETNNNIWFDQTYGDKIGIDGACAYGGQLNCLVYDDDEGSYEEVSVQRGDKP